MVHAVSATYLRFERMSPPAAGMALLLHLSIALALWWASPLKFHEREPDTQPIEVTMEAPPPKVPETQQPQPQPQPPQPAPPSVADLPPAGATPPRAAATPPPAMATPEHPGVTLPSSETSEKKPEETPKDEPDKKEEPKEALAPPKPEPQPEPTPPPVDKVLPKVDAPPPPLTMQDFVRIAPPPPPQSVVKPLPERVAPTPPPQHQALRPSPLNTNQRPAPNSGGSSGGFVNPSSVYERTQAISDYKLSTIRKFSQYLPNLRQQNEGGSLVLRWVIARDGRLVDVSVARSSGVMALDRGMVDAVRAAAPYAPMPPDIPGEQVVFVQEFQARQ